jgi:CTP:molybdopterin cytidylyltransferase MocA
MITGILLTGGFSRRFGSPKALARLRGQTVIENLQHMLLATDMDELIIVTGADAAKIQPFVLKHKHIKVVYNKHYNFGQTASFQCGLKNIDERTRAALLLPVDFPLIRGETVNALIRTYRRARPLILIPAFAQRKGHPPVFDMRLKNDFLGLDHTEGINTVGHRFHEETCLLPVTDPGVLQTFNTPEEFARLQQAAAHPGSP